MLSLFEADVFNTAMNNTNLENIFKILANLLSDTERKKAAEDFEPMKAYYSGKRSGLLELSNGLIVAHLVQSCQDDSPKQILTLLKGIIHHVSDKTLTESDIKLLHFWLDEAIQFHNQRN